MLDATDKAENVVTYFAQHTAFRTLEDHPPECDVTSGLNCAEQLVSQSESKETMKNAWIYIISL